MTSIPADIQVLIEQEMAIGDYASPEDVLRQAMDALRNERESLLADEESLRGIERGLADSAAGRYQSLVDYDRDFRVRHGLGDEP